jgi:hypothetical protein
MAATHTVGRGSWPSPVDLSVVSPSFLRFSISPLYLGVVPTKPEFLPLVSSARTPMDGVVCSMLNVGSFASSRPVWGKLDVRSRSNNKNGERPTSNLEHGGSYPSVAIKRQVSDLPASGVPDASQGRYERPHN